MKINSVPLKKQCEIVSSPFASSHTCTHHTCIHWLVARPTTKYKLCTCSLLYAHAHNTVDKFTSLIQWGCVYLHSAMDDQTFMHMYIILLLTCHLVSTCSVLQSHIFVSCRVRVVQRPWMHSMESRWQYTARGRRARAATHYIAYAYMRCRSNSNHTVWKLVNFPRQKSDVLDSFPHFAACGDSIDF